MKKINRRVIWAVVVCLVINIVGCARNEKKVEKAHRRQSWLKTINWDTERLNYSGSNIKIAIIDSGVDKHTPELSGKIEFETTVIKANMQSDVKHGTAVASIISAQDYSDNQVRGIACGAKLISVDVTNQSDGIVDVKDLIKGISVAIDCDVDIINISIGCLTSDANLEKVIKKALDKNIIIIASAGNYTKNNILYPSKYEGVVAVGSLSKKGTIMYPVGENEKKIIYLPGEKIVSAIGDSKYAGCEGTSFSTAICTGLVALLLEKKNDKKAVKEYIESLDFSKGIDFIKIINNYK